MHEKDNGGCVKDLNTHLNMLGQLDQLRGATDRATQQDRLLEETRKKTLEIKNHSAGLNVLLKDKLEKELEWSVRSFVEKKSFFEQDIQKLLEIEDVIIRREEECLKTFELYKLLDSERGLSDLSVYENVNNTKALQYKILDKYAIGIDLNNRLKHEIKDYMVSPRARINKTFNESDRALDVLFFNLLSALLESSTFVSDKKGLDVTLMNGEAFILIYSSLEIKLKDLVLNDKDVMSQVLAEKILLALSSKSLEYLTPCDCSKALLVLLAVAEEMMPGLVYKGGFNTNQVISKIALSLQINKWSDFKVLSMVKESLTPYVAVPIEKEEIKKIEKGFFGRFFGAKNTANEKRIKDDTAPYTQKDLLLPTLMILLKHKKNERLDSWLSIRINTQNDRETITTSDLRAYLKTILMLNEADCKKLVGRSDTVFDQIVRNLISNKVLEKSKYAISDNNKINQSFKITDQGIQYVIEQFTDYLNTMSFSAGVKEKHTEMAVVPAVLFELFLAKSTEGLEMSDLKKKVLDRLTLTQADQEILASRSDRKIDQVIRNLVSNKTLERLGVAEKIDNKWKITNDGQIVLGKTLISYLPLPDFVAPENMKTTKPKFSKTEGAEVEDVNSPLIKKVKGP